MEILQNDLLLRAARGEQVERTPVWVMRQAGRILPEYRAVREKAGSFIQLATNPELAAEVTLQPVDILGVDAAIIFSDILVVPEAMGLLYVMEEKSGPVFPTVINTMADVEKLRVGNPEEDLKYVLDAIKIVKRELNGRVPLIGFAGAPFTLLCYMIEGRGSKTFSKAKKYLYTEPALSHALLQKITDTTIAYLKAQIASGANLVQVFDSWAGILSPEQYRIYSLPYIAQICDAITEVPLARVLDHYRCRNSYLRANFALAYPDALQSFPPPRETHRPPLPPHGALFRRDEQVLPPYTHHCPALPLRHAHRYACPHRRYRLALLCHAQEFRSNCRYGHGLRRH